VSCDKLALRPAPDIGAYGYNPNISSSWGASVVKIKDQYHMYVSEFSNGCGLTSWQHNSHIVHATANTPTGPFEYSDTVLGAFSHNPKVLVGEHILLFHVGDGGPYPPQSQCAGGTLQPMCPLNCSVQCDCGGVNRNETWPEGLRTKGPLRASLPSGPWAIAKGGPWPIGGQCANPAPAQHPNGSVAMACHSNGLAIWLADSALGT
jgi:hypothetical protein